ncbi:MAG: class IV adenylate cyclase [Spirochaetes bacterium]|nr:MAG: class IV adenylate cyclase [Spirochaetota bacterium]
MGPYEIEIKAHCDDLDAVRGRISAMGGTPLRSGREEDTYFGHPSRDFAATDEAVRMRVRGGKAILTYKGPKVSGRSKSRYEKETGVEDGDALCEILLKLGFVRVETVVKEREIFLLDGVEVCLDRVQGAGTFVELELQGEDVSAVEHELFALAERLGLDRFERRSYLELVLGA